MTQLGIVTEFTTGTAGTVGETAAWTYNVDERWNGTSRLIIALHGHGQTANLGALQFAQNTASGSAPMALARCGKYVVCSIEAAGPVAWSNAAAMTAIGNAWTAAKTRGVYTGKYGLLGWSMGGMTGLNKIKRDAANIAGGWFWAPVADGDYINSTAGHTPVANNSTWTTEYVAAHGTYANSAGYRIWDEPASWRGLNTKIKIAHATDDAVVPYSISTNFVSGVNDANVTLRTPTITGGHTNMFQYIPDYEIVQFFDSCTW